MIQQQSEIMSRLESIEAMLAGYNNQPLNLEKAAAYLHVSKSYLYKLTSRNQIPYYKPSGKLVYFDKKELDQWILQNRITPKSEIEEDAISHLSFGRKVKNANLSLQKQGPNKHCRSNKGATDALSATQ
jgi:excisionase family DNA binding protein